MDYTTYYYYYASNIYSYATPGQSGESYTGGIDGQLGVYEGQLNWCDEQLNSGEWEDNTFKDPDSIPLPKELTNMFKPLECELCGVVVACEASAFTHYEGKAHIKNVNAYMKEHYNVYGSLKFKKERFIPVKCDVCNIELTSNVVYQQHLNGKQHQKNLKKKQYNFPTSPLEDTITNVEDLPPPPPPPVLSDFVCEICNITTNTLQQLLLHKNGQKHKRKLSKVKESKLDSAINAFYNGEWPVGSEDGVFPLDAENDTQKTLAFIENPEMDYPLQFVDAPDEPTDDTICQKAEAVNSDNVTATTTSLAEYHFLTTPLAKITDEVPIDLGVEDGKLLSSTGIILRQLSIVSQVINNKNSIATDNCKDLNNNSDSFTTSEKDNAEICNHVEKPTNDIINNQTDQSLIEKNSQESVDSNSHKSSNTEKESEKVEEVETNKEKNENVPIKIDAINSNKEKSIKDTKLDQVITKLAIEEIEKESINFEKTRIPTNSSLTLSKREQLADNKEQLYNSKNKYKYDLAGFRMNEEARKSKDSNNNNKEKDYEFEKRNTKNSSSYYSGSYESRNYNYRRYYGYSNWRNNNGRWYNNYDYSYEKRNIEYRRNRDRDREKYEKRKRERRYSSDEESGHDRKKKSSRSSYNDRKHKTRSPSRKCKSSSRSKKRKSYSSRSSYSDRSDSYSPERERRKEKKCKRKDEKKVENEKSNDKKYKGVRESNSDNRSSDSDSSSCPSTKKSNSNRDYILDKDGWCEKQHRSQSAYDECPYEHKIPFAKIKTEKVETNPVLENDLNKNYWNSEAPVVNNNNEVTSTTEIKVEKTDVAHNNISTEVMIDPALSAYMTTSGTYYCKYCIVTTKSNELFREHLQTPKHALLMKFKNKIS